MRCGKHEDTFFLIVSLFPERLKRLFNKCSRSFCCWLYNLSQAARFTKVDVCSTMFYVLAARKY
jgi:hypothetical protein